MRKPQGLDGFVRRIMKEKDLTLSDVELRAEGNISDSYVSGISAGNITNLSIAKLRALARGLGVAEAQIFSVACGISFPEVEEFRESDFGQLFLKYTELTDDDKEQLCPILDMLDREIDRRLCFRDITKEERQPVAVESGNGKTQLP
jgi:transcriptional regulator with XRE-family HTH domain